MSNYRFGLKPLKELARTEVMLKSKFGLKPLKQIVVPEIITEVTPFIFVLVSGVGENVELHLYSSADGITWQQAIIDTPNEGTTPWWASILFKNDRLHMFFNQMEPVVPFMQHIFYLSSEDNGSSFSDIFDAGEVNDWPQRFDVAVLNNTEIWVLHCTGTDNPPYVINALSSEDNGESWTLRGTYNDPDMPAVVLKDAANKKTVLYQIDDTEEPNLASTAIMYVANCSTTACLDWATQRNKLSGDSYVVTIGGRARVGATIYGEEGLPGWFFERTMQEFNTSGVSSPTEATITMSFSSPYTPGENLGAPAYLCLVGFDNDYPHPNSVGGYSKFGEVLMAEPVPISSIVVPCTIVFELNEEGLNHINKDGVTRFGYRMLTDVNNSPPTWESGKSQYSWIRPATLAVKSGGKKLKIALPGENPEAIQHPIGFASEGSFDMDFVSGKIFISYTAEDGNAYCYISDEEGEGLVGPPLLIKEGAYVLCCGINRNTPDTLYAVVIDSADWETIYLCTSTDNGETWDAVEICKGWNASKMSCEGDHFYFLVERVDDEYNQTTEIYSNRWNGFSRIPQLDGQDSLTYNRAVATSNV